LWGSGVHRARARARSWGARQSQKSAKSAERRDERVGVGIAKLAQQADPSVPAPVRGLGMFHGARHTHPFATAPLAPTSTASSTIRLATSSERWPQFRMATASPTARQKRGTSDPPRARSLAALACSRAKYSAAWSPPESPHRLTLATQSHAVLNGLLPLRALMRATGHDARAASRPSEQVAASSSRKPCPQRHLGTRLGARSYHQ
jgi:hypothetical protein